MQQHLLTKQVRLPHTLLLLSDLIISDNTLTGRSHCVTVPGRKAADNVSSFASGWRQTLAP